MIILKTMDPLRILYPKLPIMRKQGEPRRNCWLLKKHKILVPKRPNQKAKKEML
ncbi:Hypothetical protein FKW44_023109, partial [Caligus rogercresseyi]